MLMLSHVASKSEPFIFTVDSSGFSCFLRGKSLYVYVAFLHFLLKLAVFPIFTLLFRDGKI